MMTMAVGEPLAGERLLSPPTSTDLRAQARADAIRLAWTIGGIIGFVLLLWGMR
jgi:hypothetical protein